MSLAGASGWRIACAVPHSRGVPDVGPKARHAPPVREFRETPGAQFIGGHLRAEIPESFDGIEGLLPESVEDRAALLAAVEELLRLQDDALLLQIHGVRGHRSGR